MAKYDARFVRPVMERDYKDKFCSLSLLIACVIKGSPPTLAGWGPEGAG
jgi:hypothetical protein